MSDRSKRLSVYVHQALNQRPSDEAMLRRNKFLDDGFLKLKQGLREEIESQIAELSKEPGCAGVLFASLSGETWEIKRLDDHDCVVSFRFDSQKRLVSVKSEKPLVFTYFVEVQLNRNETGCCYMAGEKKKDLGNTNEGIAAVLVDKCLYALFGVEK